tara:strand:- start:127 stop:642 length:516 start_codon:yes stop_codon:yes gene_type:complete
MIQMCLSLQSLVPTSGVTLDEPNTQNQERELHQQQEYASTGDCLFTLDLALQLSSEIQTSFTSPCATELSRVASIEALTRLREEVMNLVLLCMLRHNALVGGKVNKNIKEIDVNMDLDKTSSNATLIPISTTARIDTNITPGTTRLQHTARTTWERQRRSRPEAERLLTLL